MFYVYIITSLSRNYTYIGLTNNRERRFFEHNNGKNKTTAPYRPFKLIHSETFPNRISARQREKYFKSGIGREYIKNNFK